MTTDNLREFLVLAETNSFTAAAEVLYLSVSTLSRHIMSLEKSLGASLFLRSPGHIVLSDAGRLFLPYARRIIELEHKSSEALAHERELDRTPLNVGCAPDAVHDLTVGIIGDFVRENKNFTINIFETEPAHLHECLRRGDCDLAFLYEGSAADAPDFEAHALVNDQLVAVVPQSHPLANRQSISLQELERDRFLFISPGSFIHSFAMSACVDAGFTPNVVLTSSRTSILVYFVTAGLGTALVMNRSVSPSGDYAVLKLEEAPDSKLVILLRSRKSQPFGTQLFLRSMGTLMREGDARH